ncbi:MAG: bifunctional diaminohydroxyphosphoribosylaminopyrimidine deaminase/5-amino-6-(5-phosphoribosylamino)uracil reductase RibD [Bdellovibrionales bacterium]|nr:bifunctional diaminohydroxyphosphoribosylaminopyrimidine deaminase/5-amino-6-(5-phosphoribosylamino)uracil reductase RibD [Bdellovibrionales bacterium]
MNDSAKINVFNLFLNLENSLLPTLDPSQFHYKNQAALKVTPQQAMELAMLAALKGSGCVSPNPLVGCTIVDQNHHLLSIGYHAQLGADHAEINALNKILDPERINGATVYVTLEPCAHFGKTPPCATHLAQLPIHKVVYGLQDPNPLVAGKGIEILKNSGKIVELWAGTKEPLENLAEFFLHNMEKRTAFITLKVATSADGQMALKSGESQWISGPQAQGYSHFLRHHHDATMIGRRTFLFDDPKLNVRLYQNQKTKPSKIIIMDPKGQALSALKESQIRAHHEIENIIWVVEEGLNLLAPVPLWQIPKTPSGKIDLHQLAQYSHSQGINSILVEGGASLISSFLTQNAAQKWCQFIAPQILGSDNGLNVTTGFEIKKLADKIQLKKHSWQLCGQDLLLQGRLDPI